MRRRDLTDLQLAGARQWRKGSAGDGVLELADIGETQRAILCGDPQQVQIGMRDHVAIAVDDQRLAIQADLQARQEI